MCCQLLQCKLPKRYIIVLMVFLGYVNFYYLHANIGMSIVQMTSPRKIIRNSTKYTLPAEFNWNSHQKALVISAFAYGRLFGPIGGAIAGKIGGSTVYATGTFVVALITALTPFFMRIHFYLFFVTTVLAGVFESFSYCSVVQLMSRWAPPDERAKCISIGVIGVYGGSLASFLIAGWILYQWNWEVLFYASGIASFVWFCIWIIVVKNDPSDDKRISDKERRYIQEKITTCDNDEKVVYPWSNIFTCIPLWALCLSKFCAGCSMTFTMMYLPQYIQDMNDFDIKSIGYISTAPQICSIVSTPLAGYLMDYIRSNKILSVTNVHKVYMSLGLFSNAFAFIVADIWPDFVVCMVSICLLQFFSSFIIISIQVSVLDLAPRYAAFMVAVTNSFLTAGGFSTPVFVGFYVTSHSREQWSICFLVASVLFTTVGILYLQYGSAELQPWANYKPQRRNADSELEEKPPRID